MRWRILVLALCLLAGPGAAVQASAQQQRLVTLAPHLAEMVHAAGAGDALVAVTRHSDFPAAVKALPIVGDGLTVSAEGLLAQRPTLVLAWKEGTPSSVLAQIRRLGIPVESISTTRLADIPDAIEHIGDITDRAERAGQAAAALRARLDALGDGPAHARTPPLRVFYQISTRPMYTLNGNTTVSEIIARCGGMNVFADLPMTAPQVGLESVVMARPDVILMGSADGRTIWRGFDVVPAVARDQLVVIDADTLIRPGPRLIEGAEMVCRALAQSAAQS